MWFAADWRRRGVTFGVISATVAFAFSALGVVRAETPPPTRKTKAYNCALAYASCVSIQNSAAGAGLSVNSPNGTGITSSIQYAAKSSSPRYAISGLDYSNDVSNSGVFGYSSGGYGVTGSSDLIGVFGTVYDNPYGGSAGVVGLDLSYSNFTGGYGVLGESSVGIGVLGYSSGQTGVEGLVGGSTDYTFYGQGPYGYAYMDGKGDVVASGKLYSSGNCKNGCSKTKNSDSRVLSYTPRESLPSVEDTGEAQLVNGTAYVRLGADFANLIDEHAYSVFITPEGENRGLYVTEKSSRGFVVRESQGGRSTLGFAYRIIAKPYGDASPRFPVHTTALSAAPARHLGHAFATHP